MQIFTVSDCEHEMLCDTPLCSAGILTLASGDSTTGAQSSTVETVLCVIEGEAQVARSAGTFGGAGHHGLSAMQGVQIPAGQTWIVTAGESGAKLLIVESLHPGFDPSRRLMPALEQPHRFTVASGQWLVYDDYVRGGVLNFAPGFAADKHFHQDADEIFWFFQGTCRVTGPEGAVLVEAGQIVYTPAGEWHIIENAGREPLLMFVTVTPNLVPSHTFFDAEGRPYARSKAPLTHP